MNKLTRLFLLTVVLLAAIPATAGASTVTNDLIGGSITFDAAPGEANTALIIDQGASIYYVGDQSAMLTNPGGGCTETMAIPGLPPGFLCTNLLVTALTENLGDMNDTGVIRAANPPTTTVNGGPGDDLLVGGTENDTFNGGAGSDTVAYVGISDAGITRAAGVTAVLPAFPAGASTTLNGQTGENDIIANDVEGLVGGNGDDILTGNDGPNTLAGAAPEGTPLVDTTPAGDDTIMGNGGDDTLLGGDSGSISGGPGNDTIVGGRSNAATTFIHGDDDNDTIVSGLGNDNIFGDAGSDTLAYASVIQGGLTVVDRGTNGVTAALPNAGQTATGGRTGGPEDDVIHDDIRTLVGSNGDDVLSGGDQADTIAGVAPAGTPGLAPGPGGNDTIVGNGEDDILLGGDSGSISGGPGADTIVGGKSTAATTVIHGDADNDTIVSGLGNDNIFGDAGSDTLAYASVIQGGLTVVDRGTNGVTAALPDAGLTAAGGRTGSPEADSIHDDIRTLVGSNGDDVLSGGNQADTIVGVAPAGTAGVAPGPAGNDALRGGGGPDVILGAEGKDTLDGGPGTDIFLAGAGDDTVVSRDEAAESPTCGDGFDTVTADATDTPAPDCETVDLPVVTQPPVPDTTKPRLTERPGVFIGRRITFVLSCPNEPGGCGGRFAIKTKQKLRVGRQKPRRFVLGAVTFRLQSSGQKRFRTTLRPMVRNLLHRYGSVKLFGVAKVRDTNGNVAQRYFRLRVKRK